MATGQKLTGLNPLAYIGVEPTAPPQVRIETRRPTTKDYTEYNIGTWWLMVADQEVWILISKVAGVATWIQLYPGSGGGATAFPCDVGTANEAGGEINVFGGTNINTAGAGNTVTVNLDDSVTLAGYLTANSHISSVSGNIYGIDVDATDDVLAGGVVQAGMGLIASGGGLDSTGTNQMRDLTAGVMQTNAVGVISSTNGTNGQVIIGGGTAPAWANLASADSSITITEGANSIDLAVAASSASISFFAYPATDEQISLGVGPPTPVTTYYLGTGVVWDVINAPGFNNGSALYPGDGAGSEMVFTAPSDGVYFFALKIRAQNRISVDGSIYIYPAFIDGPSARQARRIDGNVTGPLSPTDHFVSTIMELVSGDKIYFKSYYFSDEIFVGGSATLAAGLYTEPTYGDVYTMSYVYGYRLN